MSNSRLTIPNNRIQLLKAIIVIMLLAACYSTVNAQRRCSGTSSCSACTTCNYCKNCNKYGGSCGVCGGGEDMEAYEPSPGKAKPSVDNSYSPATEHAYESTAIDTAVSTFYEPGDKDHYKEEETGGGTTWLLSLIAVILFTRWLNKQSK